MMLELSKVQNMLEWVKTKLYLDGLSSKAKNRIVHRGEVYHCNFGIGVGSGEGRAVEAAKQAVSCALLETSIDGATDAIINVTGGSSLTLFEVEEAAEVIRQAANTDINTIFGAVINENLSDEVIVTVIATGFEQPSEPLYHGYTNTTSRPELYKEADSDSDFSDFDVPPFLRDRNDF